MYRWGAAVRASTSSEPSCGDVFARYQSVPILTGRSPAAKAKLDSLSPSNVLVCSVVKAELFRGAMKSNHPTRALAQQKRFLSLFSSLPFDDHAAEEFGRIRVDLALKGTPIGPYDLMIAAIAVSHGVTLVTRNTAEFSRVVGLSIEDWESP